MKPEGSQNESYFAYFGVHTSHHTRVTGRPGVIVPRARVGTHWHINLILATMGKVPRARVGTHWHRKLMLATMGKCPVPE